MRPGDKVDGRFEVERLAGAGGMGAVYRARDALTGGSVVLKLLRRGGEAETARLAAATWRARERRSACSPPRSGGRPESSTALAALRRVEAEARRLRGNGQEKE